MGGRHRAAGGRRFAGSPLLLAVAAVVAAAATGTVVVVDGLSEDTTCDRDAAVELTVAADPAVAPVLREVATAWTATAAPAVDGGCVVVQVTEATSAAVASTLATAAGSTIDVAAPPPAASPAASDLPAVWVSDSSFWVERLRAVSRTLFLPDASPLAASPVVIAATDPAAEVLGPGPVPSSALALLLEQDLPLTVAEPRRDTAGLVGVGWLQAALAPDEADLPVAVGLFRGLGQVPPDSEALLAGLGDPVAAAPVVEQAVIAHNATAPPVPLISVAVEGAPILDFPYAVLATAPGELQAAAGQFRGALAEAGGTFARHGFRAPDGSPGAGFPTGRGITGDPVPAIPVGPTEQVAPVLRIWTSARSDARVLSVVNTDASMLDPIATEDSPSRLEIFQATATQGIELFTPGSQLGVWEYAEQWSEVVPMATLTEDQKQAVLTATAGLQTSSGDTAAMFEALLAAYQEMKEGYDPGRSNTLLIWTDGGSPPPGGLTLEQTQQELERLVDVTRPIRVILLGLGPEADLAQLEAIAETTGGGAYQLLDPDQISLIFLQALLT